MSSREIIEFEGSDAQDADQNESEQGDEEIVVDVRGADWQAMCPECSSRVQQRGHESVCSECGLVVAVESLDRAPTLKAHAPETHDRSGEWACEVTNDLRVDKGLHTTFFLSSDAKGNTLTPAKKDKMERLRRRHKRFTMHNRRNQRLNEGDARYRDAGSEPALARARPDRCIALSEGREGRATPGWSDVLGGTRGWCDAARNAEGWHRA
nr:hypothetical protein [Natronomonas salina]